MTQQVTVRERLATWLGSQSRSLASFSEPVLYAYLAEQIGAQPEEVRAAVCTEGPPVYALFEHLWQGRWSPSKPFALYGYDSNHCVLDWEISLVAGFAQWLTAQGYVAVREFGGSVHTQHLALGGTLHGLQAGTNQRDLAAHKDTRDPQDLWLFEAKGKVAGGFDIYESAEALGQIFMYPDALLSGLLGSKSSRVGGHLWNIVDQLGDGWIAGGRRTHLAAVVPAFSPTPVWQGGGKVTMQPRPYYERPVQRVLDFVQNRNALVSRAVFKQDVLFAEVLGAIETRYGLSDLVAGNGPVTFHIVELSTTPSGELRVYDRTRESLWVPALANAANARAGPCYRT